MTTIRVTPAWDRTSQRLAHESARKRGAPTCAAKGLSDLRGVLRVKIAAVGSLVWIAFRMSSFERGEPMIVVRLGWGVRVFLRTRAVAVWFWERSSDKTCLPVRPVAPRRRKCML